MPPTPVDESAIRDRILRILTDILGYRPDPQTEQLADLDSLQVLELLVSLEEEFDIDSDYIIETRPDWWSSLSELVASIGSLLGPPPAQTTTQA